MLLHKDLDRPPQNTSAILGDPHHMILMLIGPMTTEANFHALVSSKTHHVARRPRYQRGALSPTGSRHVVLRASFDRGKWVLPFYEDIKEDGILTSKEQWRLPFITHDRLGELVSGRR